MKSPPPRGFGWQLFKKYNQNDLFMHFLPWVSMAKLQGMFVLDNFSSSECWTFPFLAHISMFHLAECSIQQMFFPKAVQHSTVVPLLELMNKTHCIYALVLCGGCDSHSKSWIQMHRTHSLQGGEHKSRFHFKQHAMHLLWLCKDVIDGVVMWVGYQLNIGIYVFYCYSK